MTPFLYPAKLLIGSLTALGFVPLLVGQMRLSPSDDMFMLACQNIGVDRVELLQRKFQFCIDTHNMAIRGPFTDLRKRRLDDKYLVEAVKYVEYLNARLLNQQGDVLTLSEVTIETGWGGLTAENAPVFNITMSGTDSSGKKVKVERAAEGPAYSVFKVHNVVRDPIAIRSANIACFAAFLRTVLALEKDLEPALPKSVIAPSPSSSGVPNR